MQKFGSSLNGSQQMAVEYPFDRHCLVLAGAGCGKTTVLSHRIARCSDLFCSSSRILAVTFTAKAAAEMRERVKMLIPAGTPSPFVSTFHALGCRIVRRAREAAGDHRRITVLTSQERLMLLASICTIDERRALGVDLARLDDRLARCEVGVLSLECEGLGYRIFEAIRSRFTDAKKSRGVMDYADMMQEAHAALESDPALRSRVQGAFSYVLVDEFQDTSPLQIALLKLVLGERTPLFAVGDDDQAIYGFRGADPSIIEAFPRLFPGGGCVKLEQNYRSCARILSTANKIFTEKPAHIRKVLHGGESAREGRRPVLLRCNSSLAAARAVIRNKELLEKKDAAAVRSCAILCRTNRSVREMHSHLATLGVKEELRPSIMTVHAAKGLEWTTVFLCDLEETIFPSYKPVRIAQSSSTREKIRMLFVGPPEEDLSEEKRLFYVGVTRARDHLFCITMKERELYGRLVKMRESRYLKYLS